MRLTRLILPALFLFFIPVGLLSQAPAVGFRLGPACTSLLGDSDDLKAATRYYFGFDALLPIGDGGFFIQPELNFLGQGGQVKEDDGGVKYRNHLVMNYIQLAGLARYEFIPSDPFGFSAFGGVTIDFGIGTRNRVSINGDKVTTDKRSFSDANLNAFNVGIAVGGEADYEINDLFDVFAQIRYGVGLLDIAESENFTTRTSNLAFLVGGRIKLANL